MDLTIQMLREAAGAASFMRGESYYDSGAVGRQRLRDGKIHAKVDGSYENVYKSVLWVEGKRVSGACTCPVGQDGGFCKHLVASGLTYIAAQEHGEDMLQEGLSRADFEKRLGKLSKSELLAMVLERCEEDEDFEQALQMRFAMQSSQLDLKKLKKTVRQMIGEHDPYDYYSLPDYDPALKLLRQMSADPVQAESAIHLVEYVMDIWEEQIETIDDSNGVLSIVRDELHAIHLAACKAAKPDGAELAERLIRRAIASEWEMFYAIYKDYRTIFKQAGRKQYVRILQQEWNQLPQDVTKECADHYGAPSRLDAFMLEVAQTEGDIDQCVQILSRDLSYAYSYLQIGELLRDAKRLDEAIDWVVRGLDAGPFYDRRLASFLSECYVKKRQPYLAMQMLWRNFTTNPSLEAFQDLRRLGKRLKSWQSWRSRVDEFVMEHLERTKGEDYSGVNGSLVVDIYLAEKEIEEAWQIATRYGCSRDHWVQLAKKRATTHPQDSIAIYQDQVPYHVNSGNNYGYDEAVRFIDAIWKLLKSTATGRSDFNAWLTFITKDPVYRRKRNFMARVRQKPWGKDH